MFDLKVLSKIVVSVAGAALTGGSASLAANPTAPWQVHAAAGGTAVAAYLVGLYQQSPKK